MAYFICSKCNKKVKLDPDVKITYDLCSDCEDKSETRLGMGYVDKTE